MPIHRLQVFFPSLLVCDKRKRKEKQLFQPC
uniref:Uncharacterized protein n=1 Tax=Rhizophora mucronata TaxID=61149 RepID=A0A2P2ND97_RHIMU